MKKLILILPILVGCKTTFEDSSAQVETKPNWYSFTISKKAELPSCDNHAFGRLYYSETDETFYVCKQDGWSEIEVKGIDGITGKNGAAGKDGASAPKYRIKDANGATFPGIILSPGSLWNEDEGTTAAYLCNPTCGLAAGTVYFTTTNCSGSGYANTDYTNVENARRVFANGSDRWKVSGNVTTITYQSTMTNGTCTSYAFTSTAIVAEVTHYTGDFPLAAVGPFKMVRE